MLNIRTGGDILDIGCGDGEVASIVDNDEAFYIGIDINVGKLKELKLKLKRIGRHDCELVAGDASMISLRQESMENVSMLKVLEHIPKSLEAKTILEIRRVLQHEGKVVISTDALNFLACLLDPAFFVSGHGHYTKHYVASKLNSASFRVVESEQRCYVIQALCMLIFYVMNLENYLNKSRTRKTGMPCFLWNLADRDSAKPRNNGFALMILAEKQQILMRPL